MEGHILFDIGVYLLHCICLIFGKHFCLYIEQFFLTIAFLISWMIVLSNICSKLIFLQNFFLFFQLFSVLDSVFFNISGSILKRHLLDDLGSNYAYIFRYFPFLWSFYFLEVLLSTTGDKLYLCNTSEFSTVFTVQDYFFVKTVGCVLQLPCGINWKYFLPGNSVS